MKDSITRKQFLDTLTIGSVATILGMQQQGCDNKKNDSIPQTDTLKNSRQPDSLAPSVQQKTTALPDSLRLLTKNDKEYDVLRRGFNKRIDKYPAVIALCSDTQAVASAIHYAKVKNYSIAVKSGGHCFEGFSCNDDGLVIDVSPMQKITWGENNLVTIQAGCKLESVYNELLPKGRLIPTGSCGGVGIAGLTLGGGYGLFSREFGLTCDSLEAVTFVDGNGTIHHPKGNDDIMWALRGGGNGNFGVVTELIFQTHQAPTSLRSHRFKAKNLNENRAASILASWFDITARLPNSCFSGFVLNGSSLLILVTNTADDTPDVINALRALEKITDSMEKGSPRPLQSAVKVFYGRSEPIYFKNASAGMYRSFNDIASYIRTVLSIVTSTPGVIYQVNTLGGAIVTRSFEERSAFPHRQLHYLAELQTYWESPQQGAKYERVCQDIQRIFSEHGMMDQYRNYPDLSFMQWEKSYYGSKYSRLQHTKEMFDADNLFRYEQSIQTESSS